MIRVRQTIALAASAILLVAPAAPSAAQPGTCPQLVSRALETTRRACGSLDRNQACYGNMLIEAVFAGEGAPGFSQPADIAPLETIRELRTFPLDEARGLWGVAVLNAQANIPDTLPGQGVIFILYGDTVVENRGGPQPPVPDPCPATAAAGANVRSGPGSQFNILTSVARGDAFNVTGRSPDGAWLFTDAAATGGWIAADLVRAACDLAGIPARAPGEQPAYGPMQAFTVRTGLGRSVCREAPPSALVVQGPTGLNITLNANGLNVTMGSTLAFRAVPGDRMTITALSGQAVVQSGIWTRTIPAGFESSVALGGDDGLTAEGPLTPPELLDTEAWEALAGGFDDMFDEPLDLLAFDDYESLDDYCADPANVEICDDPNFYAGFDSCGDGVCDDPNFYAGFDSCGDGVCDDPNFYAGFDSCGDGVCDDAEALTCPFDCGNEFDDGSVEDAAPAPICGDFVCDVGEDAVSCPSDCEE